MQFDRDVDIWFLAPYLARCSSLRFEFCRVLCELHIVLIRFIFSPLLHLQCLRHFDLCPGVRCLSLPVPFISFSGLRFCPLSHKTANVLALISLISVSV